MTVTTSLQQKLDPPDSVGLRLAFGILWTIDAIAAALFFIVPYASELNPVTVLFYHVFGIPGVFLAATCYAAIIIMIGHVLSDPLDIRFIGLVVALYVFLVTNNVLLLVFQEPLPDLLGI